MFDVRQLPDAWETAQRLGGEEGDYYVGLYKIYYQISTAIFDYRQEKGLSQKKLAAILGVTQAMVSKLESGDYNYSVEQLWKISQKLGFKLNISFEKEKEEVSVAHKNEGDQAQLINYSAVVVG